MSFSLLESSRRSKVGRSGSDGTFSIVLRCTAGLVRIVAVNVAHTSTSNLAPKFLLVF